MFHEDRHDAANSRFSKFFESVLKMCEAFKHSKSFTLYHFPLAACYLLIEFRSVVRGSFKICGTTQEVSQVTDSKRALFCMLP